jgi:hypothetical protein
MRPGNQIRLVVCFLCISVSAYATKITGKVANGTTQRPAAGEDVVLLSLAGGMQESARTKTDSKGEFTLEVPDEGTQHLIRVTHQGVNYFHAAPQGTTSAEITVYDSAKKVSNLIGEGRVVRVQTTGDQLEVSEMYIVRNESNPPRTWMSDRTLEVVLPDGAKVEQGMAAGPGGMPVNSPLVPTGTSNRYAFVYPLRPGRSQFQVIYKLPYNGSYDFTMTPDIPLAELGVMLPKSMHFNAKDGSFSAASDESGMAVFVARSLSPGQSLKFSVSGQGSAPREGQLAGAETGQNSSPGGGLGAPTGSPDAMSGSHWYVLGGVAVVMAAFVAWTLRRKSHAGQREPAVKTAEGVASTLVSERESQAMPSRRQGSAANHDVIMDALKEELFQLETERAEGRISEQEYAATKAGLDALFRRQMKGSQKGQPS